jgi:t-SNARE complex subunit (syntaxin)
MTAQETLADLIKSQRAAGLKGENWDNYGVALYTIRQELSQRTGSLADQFDVNDRVRDILLTNCRQDVAHALANTSSILRSIRTLKFIAWANLALVVIAIIMILAH